MLWALPACFTKTLDAALLNNKIDIAVHSMKDVPTQLAKGIRQVNTRLRKLKESNWTGAIFAAAGLERINLRPENSIDLDWMLPAPSQGAIMVVCREADDRTYESCRSFNDEETALCTKIEKDFLRMLMGGCSTPISALAQIKEGTVFFQGNICSTDGKQKINIEKEISVAESETLGMTAAQELLNAKEVQEIMSQIRNAKH
jgi:hydroxymethylbilane synthase